MVNDHPMPGAGYRSEEDPQSATAADGVPRPAPTEPDSATSPHDDAEYGIFWLDLAGHVTRWSEEAAALFGHPVGEVARLSFHDLFSEADRANRVPDRALELARDRGGWDGVGWRVMRDGRTFWAATSLTMAHTPNGVEIGLMAVTRKLDVSLSPGSAGADANRLVSLGRVASELSHDVRNILTAIRGFAELLEQRLPPEGGSHQLWHELVKACDRGADLTQRVLGVARSDQQTNGAVCVAETLRSLYPMLRQIVPRRIHLELDIDDDVPSIVATPHDVELAVLNIVVNARDAIRGAGRIRIELGQEVTPDRAVNGRVILSVGDSGEGMTSDIQDRIFDRFFTTKAADKGTGLGMSVVHDSVRAAGGSIEIESTQGEGTVVRLIFQPFSVRGLGTGGEPEAWASRTPDPSRATRALVCCASPLLATSSVELLRRAGVSARVAPDSETAVSLLTAPELNFDMLLLDHSSALVAKLPRADGHMLEGTSVVMLCEPGREASGREEFAGVDQILSMPVDPAELCDVVAELLSANRAGARVSIH